MRRLLLALLVVGLLTLGAVVPAFAHGGGQLVAPAWVLPQPKKTR